MHELKLPELSHLISTSLARRVDPDLEHILTDGNSETFWCYGSDLVLKQYKIPTDSISKLSSQGRCPEPPSIESVAFDIMPNCAVFREGRMFFGSENGEVTICDSAGEKEKAFSAVTFFGRRNSVDSRNRRKRCFRRRAFGFDYAFSRTKKKLSMKRQLLKKDN